MPLTTTVCSYLLVPQREEHVHKHDVTYFLITHDTHVESVRNKCLQLLSSLIENLGDDAIEAILLFVQNICLTTTKDGKQEIAEASAPVQKVSQSSELSEAEREAQDFQAML